MRKFYLLVMALFVQLLTCSNIFAADPPQSEYEAAMASIEDGPYYICTEIDGVKWYIMSNGGLTADNDQRWQFTVTKVSGGALYDVGLNINPGTGGHFSNTTLVDSKALLDPGTGVFRLDTGNDRNDWERQVPFMNEEGLIAIRSCNTAYGESSWADAGRAFWTYKIAEGEDWPTPIYSYDPAYIWKFEPPTDLDMVLSILTTIWDAYSDYAGDEDGFQMNMAEEGSDAEFGQRRDWDTYRKFLELIDKVDTYLGDETGELGGCTVDEANELKATADSLFNVVLDSEMPYMLPNGDGYYRIISPLRYITEASESGYVDKAILASYLGQTLNMGSYATIQRDHANFIWKLEQHGDSVAIQNVGMENYISLGCTNRVTLTQDPADASHVVFDYAGEDYVDADDGNGDTKELFYIRLAGRARNASNYFHQLDHNKGNDTGRDMPLSFWVGTFEKGSLDNASDRGTSEWYLEYVPESEVEAIIANFATVRDHDLLVEKNNLLRAQVAQALETAKESKMLTSASQMTSPFSCDNFGYEDGQTLASGALIDGNKETFWHSDYKGNTPEGVYHYIQLSKMKDMVGECEFYICDRNTTSGNWPSEITLYGSDTPDGDTEEWNEIVVFSDLATGALAESRRTFFVETPYEYIRVVCTSNSFWHAAEIQITTATPRASSQYVALGDVASNLDAMYNQNVATPDADITQEMYDALMAAYNAFMAEMVDPVELRAVMDKYAKLTESVVQGTNPGQWADTKVAQDYNALYEEIALYDKGGRYSNSQNHKYAVMLKAMAKSIMQQANPVQTDKWYRIMVPTEEQYDAYGFSKEGVDKTGLREDQATCYGTFASVGVEIVDSVFSPTEEDPERLVAENHLEAYAKDDVRESSRMYFMPDDIIEDKDVSLFRFVAREAEDADYSALLADAKDNMSMAIDMNTLYNRGEKLITDASQFSSNASCLNNDGQSLESGCLLDGNASTYWHTDYQQKILEIPYLQVALNEPVSGLIQVDITRRSGASNGHIVRMYVQGSTDAQNWSNLGYIETPYSGNTTETVSSQPLELDQAYSHLRFILTYRYGTDGGGNMEFDPFAEVNGVEDWNKKWTYFHCSEFQIYPLTPKNEMSDDIKAVQQALVAANKVVLSHATADDLAAAAQAYNSYQSAFNAESGMAVLPSIKATADPVYAIQNKATGLFVYAYGSNSNDVYLRTIPTIFNWKALGYERSLLHGKNFNGDDCTNLHVGESNLRVCTWSTTEPTTNSGLIICDADVDYAAPSEFTFYKSIKPGAINAWSTSVTITPEAKDDAALYTLLGRYNNLEGASFLAMKEISTVTAGEPAIYIYSDTTRYASEEDDAEPVLFTMPGTPELVSEGKTINGMIACVQNHTLLPREIYFSGNHPVCIGSTGYFLRAGGVAVDLDNATAIEDDSEADFLIALGEAGDKADGVENIPAAIEKISQRGNVYSMDGKLLMTGANLNNLKTLGRGMYILNGVKVVVK
ncbi:MAG: discoidin domain-containing protein [Bacteroidaceae bacterium]|nr:discoidin domain-containing protein [Bacteroidaceae bacterium]